MNPGIVPASAVILTAQVMAAAVLLLAAAGATVRGLRERFQARRRVQETAARPLILAVLNDESAADLTTDQLPRALRRRLDSMATTMATKVRGADRTALTELLRRRGHLAAARRGTRSVRPIRRLRSVELLGALGTAEFAPELRDRLSDHNPDVRRAAVRGLGRTADPAAIPALLAVLDAEHRNVPDHCVTLALWRCGAGGIDHLTAALADGGPRARRAAAKVLGWLGDVSAVGALGAALEDESVATQLATIGALGRIGAPASAQLLRDRLGPDRSPAIRSAAAIALGRLGDPGSVAALTGLLAEDHELARAAAQALGQIGLPGEQALRAAAGQIPEAREALGMLDPVDPTGAANPTEATNPTDRVTEPEPTPVGPMDGEVR